MGKVVNFTGITTLDFPVDNVIRTAGEANLEHIIVIGWNKDGEFFFSSNKASGPEALWLLEIAKKELLNESKQLLNRGD